MKDKLNVLKALHEAKLEIGKVTKNAKNPHFKSNYADINALLEAVEPILLDKGLILTQPIENNTVCTYIYHIESGEFLESSMQLQTGTPQQVGSAITYYRRYTLQSLLSLQAEDDDGNKASEKPAFTKDKFQIAKDNGATVEMIKQKYSLTKEMEQEYIKFKMS